LCGILGLISKKIDREKLQSATSLLAHRGPDDSGIYIGEGIGLGHRRLSIIDLSKDAHQPMANEDGTLHIVYNGEIYNYEDLRDELMLHQPKPGVHGKHIFKSYSDTEVILHAYEEYGPACVEKLNGMFAFAIWDSKKQQLFIARDRAGIKPLYFHINNGNFMFASEIKSLFELGANKELNKEILPDYFNYQICIGQETLFKGIKIFPQGHYAIIKDNWYLPIQYWKPEYKDEERTSDELKEILTATVERQMMSDVPVGTFLSGGLDSSIITAIASKLHSQRESEMSPRIDAGMALSTGEQVSKQHLSADTHKLKTFTAGFEGYEDEIKYAKEASLSLGTENYSVLITPRMFVDALPELIHHYDQPISFASSVALHFVSKLAKEHGVKVILTGEGADELFAGYSRYKRISSIMDDGLGHGFLPYFKGLPFKIASKFLYDPRYVKTIELIMNGNNYDYLTGVNSIISLERDKYLLKSDNKNRNHPLRSTVKNLYNYPEDNLNKLLYLDWHTYLQELLTKQDRMSMSASIESRVPFLDNDIIDFANSLTSESKLNDKTGKYILRQAAKDILPEEIINRKKIGFTVPLDAWFRGPLYEYLQQELNDPIVYEFFTKKYVTMLLKRQKRHNCSLQLWAMLNFKIWYKQHFNDI